jgi:16S rRNA (guanine966-N2)-methyltransferase
MRISAGELRGRRLQSVKGKVTRPTSDLLRQAIFNVLGPRIRGVRLLDLCAGTGSVGLEALSRGAAMATFVERDRRAVEALRSNLERLDLAARARVIARDVLLALRDLRAADETFDCIFLDPPYTGDLAVRCIEMLADGAVLRDNGVLVTQVLYTTPLPEQMGILRRTWRRRYGESSLAIYAREEACR